MTSTISPGTSITETGLSEWIPSPGIYITETDLSEWIPSSISTTTWTNYDVTYDPWIYNGKIYPIVNPVKQPIIKTDIDKLFEEMLESI